MKRMRFATLIACLGVVGILGCPPSEDADNVLTSGIYCQFIVTQEAGIATVTATFFVGNHPAGTHLILGENDDISANGVSLAYQNLPILGDFYTATIPAAETHTLVFTRQDEGPYTGVVIAPPPVAFIAPTPEDSVSRAADLSISWENNAAEGGMCDVVITGCFLPLFRNDIPDDGQLTIVAGDIAFAEDDAESQSTNCDAQIALRRELPGQLDSSLKGSIVGRTVGTTTFTSIP